MSDILNHILKYSQTQKKSLAVLIDPDKVVLVDLKMISEKIDESPASHIFVGGSKVGPLKTHLVVEHLKRYSKLPILLFPGDTDQISSKADALLFLCLTSGRNPDYLIGKHIDSARRLKQMQLEIIPTSYILIGENNGSAVEAVTQTTPLSLDDVDRIVDTAIAGELLGHKLIYLEAGSGAFNSVPTAVIREVKNNTSLPLIVGGGMTSKSAIEEAYDSGADMIVVGTAFERDLNFFKALKGSMKQISEYNMQ